MNEKNLVKISLAGWVVGLISYFLAFFTITAEAFGMKESESCTGFELLFGTGKGKDSPFNIFLWLSFLAMIAGLVLTILIMQGKDQGISTPLPMSTIAAICGAVALVCLLAGMAPYSKEVNEMKDYFGSMVKVELGIGRILGIVASIVGGGAMIAPRFLNKSNTTTNP